MARATRALHVGVIRGGKFIDDRWFRRAAQAVSVGEGEKNSFSIPLSKLPQAHALFQPRGRGWALCFTAAMQGKVELRGRELSLSAAAKEGLAEKTGDAFLLPLTEDMKGRVSLGEVTFVFNFAEPPRLRPRPVLPKEARGTLWNITDHTFATVLLISLLLHGAAVGAISRRDLPPEETAMEAIPDRFAKLLIPDKPPEVEQPPEEEKPEQKRPEKAEAKRDKPAEVPKDSAEHKAAVQKAVAQKGLIKILGSVGEGSGSALANVLSAAGGGFSDDIGAALAGAGGVALASESGGSLRKGEGSAQAAGIGGLATAGGGQVKLRERTDVLVHGSVSAEGGEAEIDSGSVDKAALSRFISLRKGSIQGCYEAQLKRSPTLHGKIILRFTIGTRGQILEVSLDSDTVGSDELASCITRLVKSWRLPLSPEADTTVTFPFLFHPG